MSSDSEPTSVYKKSKTTSKKEKKKIWPENLKINFGRKKYKEKSIVGDIVEHWSTKSKSKQGTSVEQASQKN